MINTEKSLKRMTACIGVITHRKIEKSIEKEPGEARKMRRPGFF